MTLPRIDVLVPSCCRPAALAVALTAIGAQDYPALRIVVSDQTEGAGALGQPEVVAVLRYLRATGRQVDTWRHLPPGHCGEDVLAQLRVMERFGGCGMLPSGAYHMELPTTLKAREVDAPWALLPHAGSPAQPASPGQPAPVQAAPTQARP
ncbi:hypothetical protein IM543_00150 [Massilia sp. UMI-21]|nr:hypothetical protein IM543_00150 [Massilia sp. UMI-21]